MIDCSLVVDGQAYGGWKTISIAQSLEQMARTFTVGFTERWLRDSKPLPIREGARCKLKLGDVTVIGGYVDDSDVSYDETTHSAEISGRSRTGDIFDCSAVVKQNGKFRFPKWRNVKLDRIARELLEPYGLSVSVAPGVDIGPEFRAFGVQPGETVFEALDRAAKKRGVLLQSDEEGDLVITHVGSMMVRTPIERGVIVKKGSRHGSLRERHSDYFLLAQIFGDEDFGGELAVKNSALATDAGVSRYRPLALMADAQEAKSGLQRQADWERNRRRGRSLSLSYTVVGWEHADGLWQPNQLVEVRDELLDVRGVFLLASVKFNRDETSTTTELEVMSPAAYSLAAPKREAKGAGWQL